jgi:hypothetical protein
MKRSGRDEPIWVVTHICMEATQRISLYSYPCLKLAKMLCFSYYLLCFSSTKSENKRTEQVLLRGSKVGSGLVAQVMHTHVSKCKNNKIKLK